MHNPSIKKFTINADNKVINCSSVIKICPSITVNKYQNRSFLIVQTYLIKIRENLTGKLDDFFKDSDGVAAALWHRIFENENALGETGIKLNEFFP